MLAWSIQRNGEISDLELREHAEPSPGEDQIRVRVQAAALNPADLKVLTGRGGGRFLHARKFPLRLGFDFSGVVDCIGSMVSAPPPGTEVFGFLPYSTGNRQGSFGGSVVVPPGTVATKPRGVSHAEAACAATVATTALQGLRDHGGIRAGQKVLVNGASGGVGVCAVQIAKIAGAQVWGTASATNLELVESLGADRAIDYRATRLRDLGEAFDIVFDAASVSTFAACAPILAPGGTFITLLPSPALVTGMARSLLSSKRCRLVFVRPRAKDLFQVARWMDEGRLSIPIEESYPLSDLPKAFERLRAGSVRGKLALIADPEPAG